MKYPDKCPGCSATWVERTGLIMGYACGSTVLLQDGKAEMYVNRCDETNIRNWVICKKCGALRPKSKCPACDTRRSILHGKIVGVLLMEVDYESDRLSNIADKIVEAIDE